MSSAILLAGFGNKRDVRHYAGTVSRYYNELFVETGYRPLRAFESLRDGKIVRRAPRGAIDKAPIRILRCSP